MTHEARSQAHLSDEPELAQRCASIWEHCKGMSSDCVSFSPRQAHDPAKALDSIRTVYSAAPLLHFAPLMLSA